jgi:hypothetical protein
LGSEGYEVNEAFVLSDEVCLGLKRQETEEFPPASISQTWWSWPRNQAPFFPTGFLLVLLQ